MSDKEKLPLVGKKEETASMTNSLVRIPLEWGVIASAKLAGEEVACSSKASSDVAVNRQFPGVKRRKRGVANVGGGDAKRGGGGKKNEGVCHQDNISDVAHSIMVELNKTNLRSEEVSMEIDIDYTLSKVPYREMLRDLMASTEGLDVPQVAIVLRSYEESFMREPVNKGERTCVMESECECMKIDYLNPFKGVEFLLPGECETDTVQMCVLCHRRFVQTLFYDVVYSGKSFRGVVQKYGSICGSGQYAREVMLICPMGGPTHCFPVPAVSHQRNRYTVTEVRGFKRITQHHMSPSDFQ
jgi:hypothetical protein